MYREAMIPNDAAQSVDGSEWDDLAFRRQKMWLRGRMRHGAG